MKKYRKAIVAPTAQEVLLTLADLALPFFEVSSVHRISARKWREESEHDRAVAKSYGEIIPLLREAIML